MQVNAATMPAQGMSAQAHPPRDDDPLHRGAYSVPVVAWDRHGRLHLSLLAWDYRGSGWVAADLRDGPSAADYDYDVAMWRLPEVERSLPPAEMGHLSPTRGYALISTTPAPGMLVSMALRDDPCLGSPGYYDRLLGSGEHDLRLIAALDRMGKIYSEVCGQGYYKPSKEDVYAGLAPQNGGCGRGAAGDSDTGPAA